MSKAIFALEHFIRLELCGHEMGCCGLGALGKTSFWLPDARISDPGFPTGGRDRPAGSASDVPPRTEKDECRKVCEHARRVFVDREIAPPKTEPAFA
jgi:hypothetical protein